MFLLDVLCRNVKCLFWRNSNVFIFIVVFAENGSVQCRQMKCRNSSKRQVLLDLRVVSLNNVLSNGFLRKVVDMNS
jgi:hypothetical protein